MGPTYCIMVFAAFLDSSTVEHPAVNRRVAGSNPARGANPRAHSSMVEHPAHNRLVLGSNPSGPTTDSKLKKSKGPMVKWPKTPPFHGGNPGSNPGGVTNGSIAQLGERLPYKQDVSGSSPFAPTITTQMRTLLCRGMFAFVFSL